MTSLFRSFVSALLVLSGSASAQLVTREPEEGMFTTTLDVSGPRQLLELPEGIPSEEGSATCHAHVPGFSKGAIPIFLINRTDAKASITFIGSDTNLKACRKLDNGKWERVQPSNGWAMCADSIYKVFIPPGMFVKLSVACPPSGEPATLRYQVADEWISNEFAGFFDPKSRDMAQRDLKSPADCPTWARILKSPLSASDAPAPEVPSNIESDISPGERFALRAAAIDLLQQYADFHATRLACDDVLSSINKLPGLTAEAGAARYTLLRSRPSVATATDLEFASRCLGYLRAKPVDAYYGHPSQYPGMCWEALAWLAENSPESIAVPWNEVFFLWKERLSTANLPELTGMAKFLENARLANEHVPSPILISLLKSDCPALREHSVELLLERNLDEELAEAAADLDEAGKSMVIRHVAADKERFGRRHGPLNDFLIASAKANPEATFQAIDKSTAWDQPVYLEPGLSLAFGDFFVKVVSVGVDGPVWIEDYRLQERIRRAMRYINRVALLKGLADSEAYSATKAESPVSERSYFVAREARKQSMRLGYEP